MTQGRPEKMPEAINGLMIAKSACHRRCMIKEGGKETSTSKELCGGLARRRGGEPGGGTDLLKPSSVRRGFPKKARVLLGNGE